MLQIYYLYVVFTVPVFQRLYVVYMGLFFPQCTMYDYVLQKAVAQRLIYVIE